MSSYVLVLLRSTSILAATAVAAVGGGVLASEVGAAGKHRTLSVVVSGLDNPRGLVFTHGHLYVAEGGRPARTVQRGRRADRRPVVRRADERARLDLT